MLKILLPTPDAPPKRGGVARYVAALLQARSEVVLGVLPDHWGTARIFSYLVRRVRDYHEIWTHHVVPVGTACYLFSFLQKKPYVVFLHGLDFDLVQRNAWKRFLARRILSRARRVVVNSSALRDEVAFFVKRQDIFVIHPCVSSFLERASQKVRKGLKYYSPEQLTKMLAATLAGMSGAGISLSQNTSNEPVRLLTVARLVERKGHAKVLEALKDFPLATYTVVGDGPLLSSLELRAHELGIADRVSFLPRVSDEELPELYTAHDIFVMPTTKSPQDREGFGIVYAEAGLFGLPCIGTDIPGVDEVIERDVTGFLISDTPEALQGALQKLIASPGLRSRMGSAARVRILEHFTEDIFSRKIREI